MKYKTYNNMLKAVNMIMAKGYDKETANNIAIRIFDEAAQIKNGMPIEWYIDKIRAASQKEREVIQNEKI